jgi:Asp-tRNA(Asn)/Glu-tRNA(Gln) amidotransferase A subunit family amidase
MMIRSYDMTAIQHQKTRAAKSRRTGKRRSIPLPPPGSRSRKEGQQLNTGKTMTDLTPALRPFAPATKAFKDGSDTPTAYLDRCIESIEAWEPRIGAFVASNLDGARKAAAASTERWKQEAPLSTIDGMPIGIKDIMETADMPTEQGSPLFVGWRGNRDCAAVAALREAGAVVVAKTVTTEFAATEPRGTRNPHDTERTPGGSSSGSAASVGAGMLPAALGTQVIGSILRPASFCGVYGYKPSVGGINRGGSFDGFSQSCTGVIAASLEDVWVTARAIASRAGGDAGHVGLTGPDTLPPASAPKRLALLRTTGWKSATPDAIAAFESAVAALRKAGIEVVTPDDHKGTTAAEEAITDAVRLSRGINAWEARWPLNTYARDMDRNKLSKSMQERLVQAEAMTQADYAALIAAREAVRATYEALAADVQGCVTLAAGGPPPVGLQSTGDPAFAIPSSLLGTPALTLPVLATENLPLGLQLMGFIGSDADLFAAAGGVEAALGA